MDSANAHADSATKRQLRRERSPADFDSDNSNNVMWLNEPGSKNNHPIENDDITDSSLSTLILESPSGTRRVYEFGEFVDNHHHNWVQCQSKSQPGHVYFYNVHSGCNTWYRPLSRYVSIPSFSMKRQIDMNDSITNTNTNDLELMAVSDDESESETSDAPCKNEKSLTDVPNDVITRYYYIPRVDVTSDTDGYSESADTFASGCRNTEEEIDGNNENNNNDNKSKASFNVTNFLEKEFFITEDKVNTERIRKRLKSETDEDTSTLSSLSYATPRVYSVPRLKKIGCEDQLMKWKETRVSNIHGPKKIICDMYGVRTISYDLPEPEQMLAAMGVKSSRLSDSDSDSDDNDNDGKSPLSPRKATLSLESGWRDFGKNFHQPSLSESSSSSSSWSDTSESSMTGSTSMCSTCT